MDMCWLDDQFLVSGSKDSKMALWRINEDVLDGDEEKDPEETCPTYAKVSALAAKECRAAQKIRSLCFNPDYKEIAVISLNGYIHIFNAETFSQKLSRKLPNCQDNVCIAHQPHGLYAVGCRSYTLLLDPRTLQVRTRLLPSARAHSPTTIPRCRLSRRSRHVIVAAGFARRAFRKTFSPSERGWEC